jgi:hypothetical protein
MKKLIFFLFIPALSFGQMNLKSIRLNDSVLAITNTSNDTLFKFVFDDLVIYNGGVAVDTFAKESELSGVGSTLWSPISNGILSDSVEVYSDDINSKMGVRNSISNPRGILRTDNDFTGYLDLYNSGNTKIIQLGGETNSSATSYIGTRLLIGGNAAPSYNLDVLGDINFTGTLYDNGVPFSGSGTPAGSDNEIQFNDGGSFGADSNFTYNDTAIYLQYGLRNTYVGFETDGKATSSDFDNTHFGYRAGKGTGGGSMRLNTFVGSETGTLVSDGDNNVAVGRRAGYSLGVGSNNVFIGNNSGTATTANYNSALGHESLETNSTGEYNTAFGYKAGEFATGERNLYLGALAGQVHTGDSSVMIGYTAGASETASQVLYIDNTPTATPLIYGEFDNDIVKINGTQVKATGTIADNDATPDVSGAMVWTYNGTANSVTVTDLDNPVVGATYTIIGNSDTFTITINDGGNFNLSGNWVGGADDVLTIYVQADNDYIEISRSDN